MADDGGAAGSRSGRGGGLATGGPGVDRRGCGRWKVGDSGVEEGAHIASWEGEDAAAGDILWDHVDGDVEVDDGDAEHEHSEGEGGCHAGEDGERDGDDEEEGHDEAIDGVEERHGSEILRLIGVECSWRLDVVPSDLFHMAYYCVFPE